VTIEGLMSSAVDAYSFSGFHSNSIRRNTWLRLSHRVPDCFSSLCGLPRPPA
jgi:hypothetical protein